MGQIVKKVSENHNRYYWYPGDKREWIRAGIAVGSGAVVFAFVLLVVGHAVPAVTGGAAVTAALAGFKYGRLVLRAAQAGVVGSGRAARRGLLDQIGKALWRGGVQGLGAAFAAVLIANLPATGLLANWLLPLVPALVGALAHQGGMASERMAQDRTPADLPALPSQPTDATTVPMPPSTTP